MAQMIKCGACKGKGYLDEDDAGSGEESLADLSNVNQHPICPRCKGQKLVQMGVQPTPTSAPTLTPPRRR